MAYQVTGNEYLSLPTIRENDGAVEGVTFLYMQVKGLLEIRGKDGLIRPYVELDGQRLPLCPVWSREHCWIPRFVSEEQALRFTCTYLTPVGERALVLRLSVQNQSAEPRTVRFGTDGQWDQTLHEVNETTELTEGREAYGSGWNHMFIFSQKPGLPLFAFAPCGRSAAICGDRPAGPVESVGFCLRHLPGDRAAARRDRRAGYPVGRGL